MKLLFYYCSICSARKLLSYSVEKLSRIIEARRRSCYDRGARPSLRLQFARVTVLGVLFLCFFLSVDTFCHTRTKQRRRSFTDRTTFPRVRAHLGENSSFNLKESDARVWLYPLGYSRGFLASDCNKSCWSGPLCPLESFCLGRKETRCDDIEGTLFYPLPYNLNPGVFFALGRGTVSFPVA